MNETNNGYLKCLNILHIYIHSIIFRIKSSKDFCLFSIVRIYLQKKEEEEEEKKETDNRLVSFFVYVFSNKDIYLAFFN